MACIICGHDVGESGVEVKAQGFGELSDVDDEVVICPPCYKMSRRLRCDADETAPAVEDVEAIVPSDD